MSTPLPPGCTITFDGAWYVARVEGCIPAKLGSEAQALRYVERMAAGRDAPPSKRGRRGESPMGRKPAW